MLQPLQLEEVSVRYTEEIAELSDFFAKAGLSLHTQETVGAVATRVREDRAFNRDLTSHIWVLLHAGNKQVSYSDLLGILAMAAAGPRFAASVEEADAHFLLRFLMQARGAFESPSAPRRESVIPLPISPPAALPTPVVVAAAAVKQATQPFREASASAPALFTRHTEPEEVTLDEGTVPTFQMSRDEDARRPMVWFAVGACALFLLLGGLWFLHRSPDAKAPIASTAEPAPLPPSSTVDATKSAEALTQRQDQPASFRSSAARRLSVDSRPPMEARSTLPSASAPRGNVASNAQPAPISRPNGTSATAAAPPSPTPAMAASAAIKKYPHLLRRFATVPPVVEVAPLAASTAANDSMPTGGPVRQATVRATSLGSMAGNVTYSPAPAYPQAASAQHVQGEVKIEAEVDPSGSVVSTRIISGPPLLQEAAADAVQRWRYRPFLYNDKPVGMNTTVVMDFQLP